MVRLHGRNHTGDAHTGVAVVAVLHHPSGLAARIRLEVGAAADLEPGFAELDAGNKARALDVLIAAIRPTRPDRDDIRRVVVGILDELGLDDPLTATSRARLAAALY